MAQIALIDLVGDGHHPLYLRLFATALATVGHKVVIFCPNPEALAVACASSLIRCISVTHQNQTARIATRWQVRRAAIERLRLVRRQIVSYEEQAKMRFELVFFPYLDHFMGQGLMRWDMGRFLGFPFTGLYMHLSHLRYPRRYAWARVGPMNPDHALSSKLCRGLAVLDEGCAPKLSNKLGGKPVFPFPDVAPMDSPTNGSAPETSAVRAAAAGRTVIGLIGSLEKRKGLIDFIKLAEASSQLNVFFLAAGKVAWQSFSADEQLFVEAAAKHPPHNLCFVNQWLPDSAIHAYFRSCDALFVAYHRFANSSNLLTRAAELKIPVMVSDYGLIAQRVRQYGTGRIVPEGDVTAMKNLLAGGCFVEMRTRSEFEQSCEAYARLHSFDRLTLDLSRLVEHCLS